MQEELVIDHEARLVSLLPADASGALDMSVPELFGAIHAAERRGQYIVVTTANGRVSFHADTPRRVADAGWRRAHPLAGKIHWHSIRKALRDHCLLPELSSRVDFFFTHHAYASGARSSSGSAGRVVVDRRIVYRCAQEPTEGGIRPAELGAALAEYLYLAPASALASDTMLVASVALLDRRLSDACFDRVARARFEHQLWESFYDLRASTLPECLPKSGR